eukprot:554876-Rhodomonas_salina.1
MPNSEPTSAGKEVRLVLLREIKCITQHSRYKLYDGPPQKSFNPPPNNNICISNCPGEFETFTLDCPLYKHKLVIDEQEVVQHQEDDFAPVAYLRLSKWHVAAKNAPAASQNAPPPSEVVAAYTRATRCPVLTRGCNCTRLRRRT